MDGDGDNEMIVGAYEQNTTSPSITDPGYAYVIKGGTLSTTTSAAFGTIYGTATNDYAAFHLGSAGDVDDDGVGDFFVTAYQRENGTLTDAGQVVLYSGASYAGGTATLPTGASTGKALFSGPAASQNLGYGADGAGDMDGDGADEFIVGGPGSSSSTSTGGVAFLVYGTSGLFGGSYTQLGASGTSAVDAYWTGEANGDRLGLSVAGLGDTDGDGYDDVAVSADYSDPGVANAGRVYIVRGGTTHASSGVISSIADAILSGESADDYFGRTVQGIGDMNRDGFMDLAVGATGRDLDPTGTTVSGAGSTYVFYGPLADTTGASADFVVRGTVTFDAVGSRIAPGGDVDADGYDDLVMGVAAYDPGSPVRSSAGAVFLFTGSGE
jgi:glycosylphosphatidylinositol phospholipase D